MFGTIHSRQLDTSNDDFSSTHVSFAYVLVFTTNDLQFDLT